MEIHFESEMPKEMADFQIEHFKEVFEDSWEEVLTPIEEEVLVARENGRVAGGCVIKRDVYYVRFSDFAILPGNRGKGLARKLMSALEEITRNHHKRLGKQASEHHPGSAN